MTSAIALRLGRGRFFSPRRERRGVAFGVW
jgi:hypothetical protein